MSKRIQATLLSAVLVLALSACDINIIQSPAQPNFELTITAQALVLQQGGQAPLVANSPTANPLVANVVNPPAANNANPAATNTPNPPAGNNANNPPATGPVTVTVSVETNCRSGPGVIYNSVYSMSVSDVAEVIGKNTLTNYWIIKIPNGGGATCWLWGQYATVKGNTDTLPEFATPTPQPPTATKKPTATLTSTAISTQTQAYAPPSNLQVTNKTCSDQGNGTTKYKGTITWTDNTNDEFGFLITMPGFATSVGPNVTTYNFDLNLKNVSYAMGSAIKVEVTAANATQTAASNITFTCP
jgi:uncharacterized protein YgiM (DUF1202 family)